MAKKKPKRARKNPKNPSSMLIWGMDRKELLALRREINVRLEELRYEQHVREVKNMTATPDGWGPGKKKDEDD
jgi:hypothetical protein